MKEDDFLPEIELEIKMKTLKNENISDALEDGELFGEQYCAFLEFRDIIPPVVIEIAKCLIDTANKFGRIENQKELNKYRSIFPKTILYVNVISWVCSLDYIERELNRLYNIGVK